MVTSIAKYQIAYICYHFMAHFILFYFYFFPYS
jgi:hypothetical protein